MILAGSKNPLTEEDLWLLNEQDKTEVVVDRFLHNWNHEVQKFKIINEQRNTAEEREENGVLVKSGKKESKKLKPSFTKVLVTTFGPFFSFSVILKLAQDLLSFVGPQLLQQLITYTRSTNPVWQGYLLAFSLFFAASLQTTFLQQYFHCCFITGMRVRSAIVGSVYRKAIKLSSSARKGSTVGEIVNLMSVDAQRMLDTVSYINVLWSGPLQIILALYFLWQQLGPSVLAGVAVMVLLIPFNGFVATRARKIQVHNMEYKDGRIKITNEVLSGIKALKMYAWEVMFKGKVAEIRSKEMRELRKAAWLQAIISFTFVCAPFLVSFATFGVYVLVDENNVLDAEKTFVSLSLFNLMRFPLLMLPNVITSLVQASVSVNRLCDFLCNEEVDLSAVDRKPTADHTDPDIAIRVRDASFKWSPDDPDDTLKDISLEIPRGKLVAVVGQVGCGKSSLISAILGDMEKQKGYVGIGGDVAYVAQQSWIQNLSVRDNILFGKKVDRQAYKKLISSCELTADLDMLPAGDLTEIGERGINLSGGQKQRVAIARAVFQDADVYLFDDPLSAVDAHVGRNIFDNVIGPSGSLNEKTRVLVTHGLSYLPEVDHIVVLVGGRVSESGSYQQLMDADGAFAELIRNYAFNSNDQVEEVDEKDFHKEQVEDPDVKSVSGSHDDLTSVAKEANKKKQAIYEEEKAEVGNVSVGVYLTYMRAIGISLSIIIVFFYFAQNAALVGSSIWLAEWTGDPVNPDGTRDNTWYRLGVYGAFGVAQSAFALASSLLLFISAINASGVIHNRMIDRLVHSPLRFFDVTPIGRIINRCGKDTDIMDDLLIRSVSAVLGCMWRVVGTIFVICFATAYFAIALVPLAIVYYFIQRVFIKTSRQLKRLQSVSRSPIFSHFGETLTGSSTIRAFSREQFFIKQNEMKVDRNQMSYYPNIVSNRWLAFRLEMLSNLIILLAAMFAVYERGSIDPGIVGLSISYALQVTQTFNWMVRMVSEMESNIVAVERIEEYTKVEQEAPFHTDKKPDDDWPPHGAVEFVNYAARYRPELDLVIKNINFKVNAGEKIGIVGRTGAGKSSLTLALFRIIEAAEGSIHIDSSDISELGLADLRSRLAIIPQEPILFTGTLRFNLDPFDAHDDEAIWSALRHSHLLSFVSTLPDKLHHEVCEGGDNLSVGQRQLVCLARALLRNSKILVLDEATAAVDMETDDLIQATIREAFAHATTFTIAHRLNTIMDSTKIMVLDRGQIVQFASPEELLENKDGIFYGMAHDAGII